MAYAEYEIVAGLEDPQDPLPESKWFWRRLYIFSGIAALLLMLAWTIFKSDSTGVVTIAIGLILLIGWRDTLYMIAPSAEHIVRLLASITKLKITLPNFMPGSKPDPEPEPEPEQEEEK